MVRGVEGISFMRYYVLARKRYLQEQRSNREEPGTYKGDRSPQNQLTRPGWIPPGTGI